MTDVDYMLEIIAEVKANAKAFMSADLRQRAEGHIASALLCVAEVLCAAADGDDLEAVRWSVLATQHNSEAKRLTDLAELTEAIAQVSGAKETT